MTNIRKNFYKSVFLFTALYDWVLGLTFLFFYRTFFEALSITIPENPAYLSLSAVFVFGLGFLYYFAYAHFQKNRDLVKIGTLYKFGYVFVGLYYLSIGLLPHYVFLIFGLIDAIVGIISIQYLISSHR